MDSLKIFLKRYRVFLVLFMGNLLLLVLRPDIGRQSFVLSWDNLLNMIAVIPPIFILLGLLDVWLKRETMIRYMGEGSGFIGILIGFLLGSAAAGPLYAAFPVALLLLKKGAKFSNVIVFLGAWSTTKIPLLLFEASAMGMRFFTIRLVTDVIGIAVIAIAIDKILTVADKKEIYDRVQHMD